MKANGREMIKWMAYNIQPPLARVTVQNYLRQSGRKVKKPCRKLSRFHDLVMDMVKKFAKVHELGMRPKAKAAPTLSLIHI